MITARIQENWQLDGHEVLLKERRGDERPETTYLLPARDGHEERDYPGWVRVPIGETETLAGSRALYLPPGALEAIIEAGARHIGPDIAGAVQQHLQDTIGVRDRLLELVLAAGFDRVKAGAALDAAQRGR